MAVGIKVPAITLNFVYLKREGGERGGEENRRRDVTSNEVADVNRAPLVSFSMKYWFSLSDTYQ